ncbi:hypothetical protein [Streptomyces sp. NPDC050121]|uniref:hypothetical protein n=1 Tax=Streptomyces sp. NPDC050121 TaxID=3365601 RepID=UPI0037A24633
MIVLVLVGLLVLVLGACACVWWTARGDAPRWARVASAATLATGTVADALTSKNRKSSSGNPVSDSGGDSGPDS